MADYDKILAALEQKGAGSVVLAPSAPASFIVQVDGGEADNSAPDGGEEVLDVVGLALGIVYVGSSGEETRRRITVRSLVSRGNVLLLNAFCHEREAVRQFRADRIEELVVLSTGEVIEDVTAFFDSLSGRDPTAEALSGCRHALQVLTFLARCDGHLHPDEQEEIVDYVLSSAPDPTQVDEGRVRRHVAALYPDPLTYSRALRAIRFGGGGEIRRLSRYIRRVLDADGLLHEAEFEAALEAQMALPQG